MKLNYLGYLGFCGFLGLLDGRFFCFFFLFFLFLADLFPKRGMGLVKTLILFAITGALIAINLFKITILQEISLLIPLWMVCFLSLTTLYPTGRNIPADGIIDVIADPFTGDDLVFDSENKKMINRSTGTEYKITGNIPVLMDEGKLEGMNRKYASIYDKFAAFYDLSQKIIYTVFYGGEKRKRMQFLRKLEVRDGETVLETSCGTGGNFHYLPKGAFYHGMDISAGMLAICLKNLNRWGRKAFLVRAEAENLPYKNGSFDVVFQYGGFNFFNDRKKALNEMIRVARPGARLMIADETEQVASASKGLPCIGNIYTNKGYGSIYAPVDMIPEEMENVKCDILFDGTIYCITFRKPLE